MKINTVLLSISITAMPLAANCLHLPTHLEVGECYEKEHNTNLAQAAYERALLEDSDNVEARLKLARLYDEMQMKEQVNAVLLDIDKKYLTPAQRTSLATLRTAPKVSLSTFKTRISMDGGYDSNINVSPGDALLNELAISSIDDETSTLFTRLRADVSYLHDLQSAGGWFLRTDANLYYQNNASAHYYDVRYGRVYAGGGYRSGNVSFYIPLFYDRLHYLDRDLLQEYGVRPDLNVQLGNTFFVNVNATYTVRRYIQSADKLRDDDIIGTGAGLFLLLGKNFAYIKMRYENYTAANTDPAVYTDKTMWYGMIGGIYSIKNIADLHLDYQYRYGDFKKTAALKRDDTNHDIRFALERNIMEHLRLSVQYRYITNRSNYKIAEYDKHEMMLGIAYIY